MLTLKNVKIGETVRIVAINGEGALRQHFLDMGLIPGTEVTVVKYAPMGDPVELELHGYKLTLRLADADRNLPKAVRRPKRRAKKAERRSTRDLAKAESSIRKAAAIRFRTIRSSLLRSSAIKTAEKLRFSTSSLARTSTWAISPALLSTVKTG